MLGTELVSYYCMSGFIVHYIVCTIAALQIKGTDSALLTTDKYVNRRGLSSHDNLVIPALMNNI